jgi:hypothetical protein
MIRSVQSLKILRAALAVIVVGLTTAYVPRAFAGLWGLPNPHHYFSYHPDEIFLLLPSFGFAEGDWNPHFFNYGTLYIYLVGIPAVLFRVVPDAAQFPTDLRPLYALARAVTMWMGIATIALLCFAFGRKDRWVGILSAVLLAICPLHIVNSGYATVDVPATFWLTLAFLFAIYGAERPNPKWGALVGLAVGLAAATKYNAGLFLLPAIAAPLLISPAKWRWSWCLAIIGGAVLGFIVGCPFFWTSEFREGLSFEVAHARVGGTLAFVETGNGWWYHVTRGLPVGLGLPFLAAVVAGAVAAVRRPNRAAVRRPNRPARLSLLWVVFYLAVIGFGRERFIRYLVPLTPFLAVLAAVGMTWLYRSPRLAIRIPVLLAGIGIGVLTWGYGLGPVSGPLSEDARDLAWERIKPILSEAGPKARVGLVQSPWYYHPPVSPFNAGPFSRGLFEDWNQRTGRRVLITGWDADRLREEKPDFFFLSDLESQDLIRLGDRDALGFVAALDTLYQRREEFPGPRPRSLSSLWRWLFPGIHSGPPDWLYRRCRVTLYSEPRS